MTSADRSPDYARWVLLQARAALMMSDVVSAVHDWAAPTPCAEWSARDVLAHVVDEQSWVPGLLAGGTLDEVGEDLEFRLKAVHESDGARLAEDWSEVVAPVAAAWRGTPSSASVQLSYGLTPVEHYLAQQTADTAIHAWDLAVSQGLDVPWDADLAVAVLDFTRADLADSLAPGLFDDPVPGYADPDTDPQDAAIALNGRDPHWFPARGPRRTGD